MKITKKGIYVKCDSILWRFKCGDMTTIDILKCLFLAAFTGILIGSFIRFIWGG